MGLFGRSRETEPGLGEDAGTIIGLRAGWKLVALTNFGRVFDTGNGWYLEGTPDDNGRVPLTAVGTLIYQPDGEVIPFA